MTTSPQNQQNALEQAKQGNPRAIEALINRHLQPKGITAKVSCASNSLLVFLESATIPNQNALTKFVHQGIKKLDIKSIQSIKIYGRQTGAELPSWSETLIINSENSTIQFSPINSTVTLDKIKRDDNNQESILSKAKSNLQSLRRVNINDIKNSKFTNPAILVFSILILGISGVHALNYSQLQSPINNVLKADSRNKDIKVAVRFDNYINNSILIYDLQSIDSTKSKLDVFRIFLQFSEKVKARKFEKIYFSFRGNKKFWIDGTYFQKLGEEYSSQNPVYTIRTFPSNLINLEGSKAYGEWTGGLLGVVGKQMEDFSDFHQKWYLNDMGIILQNSTDEKNTELEEAVKIARLKAHCNMELNDPNDNNMESCKELNRLGIKR